MEEEKSLPKLQSASSQKIRIEPPKRNNLESEKINIEVNASTGEVPDKEEVTTAQTQEAGHVQTGAAEDKRLSPLWLGMLGVSCIMLILTLYILIKQVF